MNRLMARWRVQAEEWVASLAGNPAPLPRRLLRRSLVESIKVIQACGIPSFWDLQKYSQDSEIDLIETHEVLGFRPAMTFDEAFFETSKWLRMHYSDTLLSEIPDKSLNPLQS